MGGKDRAWKGRGSLQGESREKQYRGARAPVSLHLSAEDV